MTFIHRKKRENIEAHKGHSRLFCIRATVCASLSHCSGIGSQDRSLRSFFGTFSYMYNYTPMCVHPCVELLQYILMCIYTYINMHYTSIITCIGAKSIVQWYSACLACIKPWRYIYIYIYFIYLYMERYL